MLSNSVDSNNALFMFDMLVDTDFGLFKLIAKEYNNPKYFHQFLFDAEIDELLYLFCVRSEHNPLTLLLIDNNSKDADELYTQFITEKYSDVLDNSEATGVIQLFNKFSNSNNMVIPAVLCKSELEEKCIKRICSKYNISEDKYSTILCDNIMEMDISIYDTIYLKYYSDILYFKGLIGKNIVIADCNYNKMALKDELYPDPRLGMIVMKSCCELKLINLYMFNEETINQINEGE